VAGLVLLRPPATITAARTAFFAAQKGLFIIFSKKVARDAAITEPVPSYRSVFEEKDTERYTPQ
jgi:hypothetical protein